MDYLTPREIQEIYKISASMVSKINKEMIESKRYPQSAIIGNQRFRRIDAAAFQDYMENMEQLRHPTMRRFVKPYKQKKGA